MEGNEVFEVYASGGGAHHPVLMNAIRQQLSRNIRVIDELGVSGDEGGGAVRGFGQ